MIKNQPLKQNNENQTFIKGMTLQQYMAKAQFEKEQIDCLQSSTQDNLYDSCKAMEKQHIYHHKRNYKIDQIDEQSVEESKDYHKHQDTLQTPGFQQIDKEDGLQTHAEIGKPIKGRTNSISMSTAITFKNSQPETNNLRFKRLSVSPLKKKSEAPAAFPGASITLYGSKFGQSPQPQKQAKMPQMLTFYGKLQLQGEQVLKRKASVKQSQLKQKFKKKTQQQLNKIIQLQHQNRVSYHAYPDLKVQGFGERKNKLM